VTRFTSGWRGEDPVAAGELNLEIADGVAKLTIVRPSDGNRLTPDILAHLAAVAQLLVDSREVHALVLIGAGTDYFSRGIFDPALRAAYSKEDVLGIVRLANRAYDAIEALPQIVIAALNGITRAGGAELALAADIRLASETARMQFPEAAWGGFPGAAGPVRLPALIGRAQALELICTGQEIDAAEMLRLGLVNRVVPAAAIAEEAMGLARRIASNGPLAVRGAKRIVNARTSPGFASARELSDALRRAIEYSHDVDEAIAAHREQRTARFENR
jgi:enoyl-CoA hydratase/carnithine racemase